MMSTVNIDVQADPTEEPAWAGFARRVEELAFDGLLVAGHPGAGHTPVQWTMRGLAHPPSGERVDRMIEFVDATRLLLFGDEVTVIGAHVTLRGARLDAPRAQQQPVPLLVGGNGRRVLRYAAEHADVVGLFGLGRTLEDGH
jgi:alkanesulfonate monooxygenase SsuD/methylene tetrahydromethanopterin reductase-like flavin-dependent oxidoreductase (luciferase family)